MQARNPADGTALEPSFPEAEAREVEAAASAAVEAFEESRALPAARWAELLEAIAERISSRADALIARAGQETALPPARLTGELARTTNQLKMFAALVREGSWVDAVIDRADPARQPLPKPDVRRMLRPIGPVVVFDASNFPFAFGACGGDTAAALAAGCPVIVKAHPGHPGTDELFAGAVLEALEQTHMELGLFSLLHGAGNEIGRLLVQHSAVEAVGFTGSQAGGRALFDLAAARSRPIPVYAEMGSLNPLVALPGALAERSDALADGLAQSVTMGGGQFCTKPGLVFLIKDERTEPFLARLTSQLEASPSATLLGANIRGRFGQVLEKYRGVEGLRVRAEGRDEGYAGRTAALLEVDADVWRESAALSVEAFGPATLAILCRDDADLLLTLAELEGHLTGSLHIGPTDQPVLVRAVTDTLERRVGRVLFNGYPTGVEVCHAMVHGGPYPATTAPGTTSVGTLAIKRFARPVAFQNVPAEYLPAALQNSNPNAILRLVDGSYTRDAL